MPVTLATKNNSYQDIPPVSSLQRARPCEGLRVQERIHRRNDGSRL